MNREGHEDLAGWPSVERYGSNRKAGRLAVLRAVDATESDTFSMVTVQYLDGVAVKNGDDLAGEVGERGIGGKKEHTAAALTISYGDNLNDATSSHHSSLPV